MTANLQYRLGINWILVFGVWIGIGGGLDLESRWGSNAHLIRHEEHHGLLDSKRWTFICADARET